MVMLNKENFALGVINNIIIVDKNNIILFIGDIIMDVIYKGEDRTGVDILSDFPGSE